MKFNHCLNAIVTAFVVATAAAETCHFYKYFIFKIPFSALPSQFLKCFCDLLLTFTS